MSGLTVSHLAWPSESEHVSSTGVPAGILAARASGSILSASMTALTLPGFSSAPRPSGSFLGHGALGADLVDRGEPGRERRGVAVRPHPVGDDVQVSAGQRLKEAQRVDLWGADVGVRGKRHRVNGAFADRVHRDAGLVGGGLLGKKAHRGLRAGGVDGADDLGRPLCVRTEARLPGADLVVAQAGHSRWSDKQLGQLAHVAHGARRRRCRRCGRCCPLSEISSAAGPAAASCDGGRCRGWSGRRR